MSPVIHHFNHCLERKKVKGLSRGKKNDGEFSEEWI